LVKVLVIVIGLGLILAAAGVAVSVRSFTRKAATAEGVVVRLNAGGSHPQIEFTTGSGQKVSYPQGGLICCYRAGERVRVLYETDRPNDARLNTFGALWFTPLILLLVGTFLVLGGLSMAAAGRTSTSKARAGETTERR
jgi:hypothetical protein